MSDRNSVEGKLDMFSDRPRTVLCKGCGEAVSSRTIQRISALSRVQGDIIAVEEDSTAPHKLHRADLGSMEIVGEHKETRSVPVGFEHCISCSLPRNY